MNCSVSSIRLLSTSGLTRHARTNSLVVWRRCSYSGKLKINRTLSVSFYIVFLIISFNNQFFNFYMCVLLLCLCWPIAFRKVLSTNCILERFSIRQFPFTWWFYCQLEYNVYSVFLLNVFRKTCLLPLISS